LSNVINICDYLKFYQTEESMPVEKVWKSLKDQDGRYFDFAQSPPFNSHHNLHPIRKELMSCIPYRQGMIDKIFFPFTYNAEPFFSLGVESCYFNHKYEPFTILFYVMRDHYRELYDMVNGVIISSNDDYEGYKYEFNKAFKRVLDGKGCGRSKGLCSVDEMIRMGSLFYILQKSCKPYNGIKLDSDRRFQNKWCEKTVKINVTIKELAHYSEKLKEVYMSGLDWKNFFFRYINKTDENTLWFFNLPKPEEEETSQEKEFTYMEFFSIFDNLITVSKRGGYSLIVYESDDDVLSGLISHFKFAKNKECYRSNYFYLYPDISEGSTRYGAISNYSLHEKDKFSKIKVY
jgi:hypothetical protein